MPSVSVVGLNANFYQKKLKQKLPGVYKTEDRIKRIIPRFYECDIESATVSKMIDNLEKKEMLTRKINPKNKRAYQLNITEYGKESLKKWNAHCLEIENISLKDFLNLYYLMVR